MHDTSANTQQRSESNTNGVVITMPMITKSHVAHILRALKPKRSLVPDKIPGAYNIRVVRNT